MGLWVGRAGGRPGGWVMGRFEGMGVGEFMVGYLGGMTSEVRLEGKLRCWGTRHWNLGEW